MSHRSKLLKVGHRRMVTVNSARELGKVREGAISRSELSSLASEVRCNVG